VGAQNGWTLPAAAATIEEMPYIRAPDGTRLAYHAHGEGRPLICLPGGPMRDTAYFGEMPRRLSAAGRQVILLDLRGTGQSATPDDPASYRCDRLVPDVEALRQHLGAAAEGAQVNEAGPRCISRMGPSTRPRPARRWPSSARPC
jgi:proline iminopeptidase